MPLETLCLLLSCLFVTVIISRIVSVAKIELRKPVLNIHARFNYRDSEPQCVVGRHMGQFAMRCMSPSLDILLFAINFTLWRTFIFAL